MVEGVLIGLISWVQGVLLGLPIGKLMSDAIGIAFVDSPLVFSIRTRRAAVAGGRSVHLGPGELYPGAQCRPADRARGAGV